MRQFPRRLDGDREKGRNKLFLHLPFSPSPWKHSTIVFVAATSLLVSSVAAQQAVVPDRRTTAIAKLHPAAVTQHTGTFNGKKVAYTATVDETIVANATGRPSARIVSVAYTADGANPATRPVIFVCNGGPISPSIYLHMLGVGPRVIAIPADLTADSSQFTVVDNPYAVLDVADLVFFDPASTGWSRVLDGVKVEEYYTTDADAQQMAAFVDRWTRENGRTASPKYLLGESYATLRVPEAAKQLARLPEPVLVDGIFLMGQAANQLEVNTRPYNIIAPAIGLPSIAAAAWHHNKVDRRGLTVWQWMDSARHFSANEYINALFKGTVALDDATKQRIAGRLQSLTGIPSAYFLANNLRITRPTFQQELFKAERLKLGSDDARYSGPVDGPEPDAAPSRAAARAFVDYARSELKVTRTDEFRTRQFPPSTAGQGRGGGGGWAYAPSASPFNDFPYTSSVTEVMNKNPKFRVYVGSGIYDMKTTTGAADYLVSQSGWPKDRVRVFYYEGGHMAYTNPAAMKQFNADVRAMAEGK
jgi:carboxypeptidase C (cathepsin A)